MYINILKKIICFFALAFPFVAYTQNTIGGLAKTVPEEEVNRQSTFVDAERERLLGHQDKALDLYKKFTYDNPDIGPGWYGLSRTYYALGDLANALETIAKAIEKEPDNEWYLIFQADVFEKTGRIRDALKVYENLVKRFPETLEFLEHLAYLEVLSANPEGGLRALEKIERIRGVEEETSFQKHMIYVGMGEDKKAAAELRKLADTYPGRLEYRHRLAEFYDTMGDKANARSVYQEILAIDPNDKVARLAAVDKSKSSSDADYLSKLKPLFADPKVSIDAKIKEILPFFPKLDAGADQALADNLLELGAAVETAHPEDPKAWSLSGDLLYHANQPAEALKRYKKCIALNPTVFSVWENTLDILLLQKNYAEMLQTAEQAMDAFPNQPRSYWYFGLAANEKGRYDDAMSQLEQALLMTGNNQGLKLDIIDQIGRALIGKKDFAGARSRYEQVLTKGGDKHPGILEHYGDALFGSGDAGKALDYWRKANAIRKSPELEQKIASEKR